MTHRRYTTQRREFQHLTCEKREQIEILLRTGMPKAQITRMVGIARSTLCNELKRGTVVQMDTNPTPIYAVLRRHRAAHV